MSRPPSGPSLLLLALVLGACRAADSKSARTEIRPDVPISRAPFREVHAAFKDRLEQPYVFLELRGSYAEVGRSLPALAREMKAQGLSASGPPFGLFFDDPGSVPVAELRARIGFPVDGLAAVREPLRGDVLPAASVAYAFAGGPYPEVPRCYPGLLDYIKRMHWVLAGPIREIYLVAPETVQDWSELCCEIQIPVAMAP